jgi:16S rRNA (uracil1498-N3)-methyltransferase
MFYRLVINPTQIQGEEINLTPEQSHYLNRVLRLKNGDRFVALDGRGKAWVAENGGTAAQILEPLQESTELPVKVTLIVALPKGNGFDEVVRCCTELGVTTLIPLISQRTLLHPSPQKLERWRKIATEAAEQSERQIVPTISEPLDFSTALTEVGNLDTNCYICVTRRKSAHLLTCLPTQLPKQLIIATGPEGGWTEEEVEQAIATGFQPVSLGSRILRAVTAPIVSLSLIAALSEQTL